MRMKMAGMLLAVAMLLAASAMPAAAQGGPPPGGPPPGGRPAGGPPPMGPQFRISSTAFSDGGAIPVKYTCAAGPTMVSPAISWTNAPKGTESFTLIVHDPDAHVPTHLEDITHWVIFDIPGTSTGLEEGVKADAPATVGVQAKNIMGAPSYMGSCAPTGPDHHYTFELFALNTKLNLPAGSTRAEVVKAMDGHVLAGTVYIGLFHRAAGTPRP